jgi:hypothetical protein
MIDSNAAPPAKAAHNKADKGPETSAPSRLIAKTAAWQSDGKRCVSRYYFEYDYVETI